jgi:hypothetical protein
MIEGGWGLHVVNVYKCMYQSINLSTCQSIYLSIHIYILTMYNTYYVNEHVYTWMNVYTVDRKLTQDTSCLVQAYCRWKQAFNGKETRFFPKSFRSWPCLKQKLGGKFWGSQDLTSFHLDAVVPFNLTSQDELNCAKNQPSTWKNTELEVQKRPRWQQNRAKTLVFTAYSHISTDTCHKSTGAALKSAPRTRSAWRRWPCLWRIASRPWQIAWLAAWFFTELRSLGIGTAAPVPWWSWGEQRLGSPGEFRIS